MKYSINIILLLFTFSCFSQSTLKFIDSKTGEPVYGFYSNIYKNGNTFADCGASNENGFKKIRTRNFDSMATYQVGISNLKYESIWQEIEKRNDWYNRQDLR